MTLPLFLSIVLICAGFKLMMASVELREIKERNNDLMATYNKLEKDFVTVHQMALKEKQLSAEYRAILDQAITAAFKDEFSKYKDQIDGVKRTVEHEGTAKGLSPLIYPLSIRKLVIFSLLLEI